MRFIILAKKLTTLRPVKRQLVSNSEQRQSAENDVKNYANLLRNVSVLVNFKAL